MREAGGAIAFPQTMIPQAWPSVKQLSSEGGAMTHYLPTPIYNQMHTLWLLEVYALCSFGCLRQFYQSDLLTLLNLLTMSYCWPIPNMYTQWFSTLYYQVVPQSVIVLIHCVYISGYWSVEGSVTAMNIDFWISARLSSLFEEGANLWPTIYSLSIQGILGVRIQCS